MPSAREALDEFDRAGGMRSALRRLPYPAAAKLRSFLVTTQPRDRYEALLLAAENLIKAGAARSLAGSDAADEPGAPERWRGNLTTGLSLGAWDGVLRARPGPVAPVIEPAMRSLALKAMEALVSERNLWAHGSAPRHDDDARDRLPELEEALGLLVVGLAPVERERWAIAEKSSLQRDGRVIASAKDMTGDHPDFERVELPVAAPLIEGDVYAIDRTTGAVCSLAPYCVAWRCRECHSLEVYWPDRWRKSLDYRSVERGHIAAAPDAMQELFHARFPGDWAARMEPSQPLVVVSPVREPALGPSRNTVPAAQPTASERSLPVRRLEGWDASAEEGLVHDIAAHDGVNPAAAIARLIAFSKSRAGGPSWGASRRFRSVAMWHRVGGAWTSTWTCFARPGAGVLEINMEYLSRNAPDDKVTTLVARLSTIPAIRPEVARVESIGRAGRVRIPVRALADGSLMDSLLAALAELVDTVP